MLRKFCSCVPSIDDAMGNQKELSSVSDEEFARAWQPLRFTWYHRLFQFVCFIVFLGPIRAALGFLVWLLLSGAIVAFRGICELCRCDPAFGREPCLELFAFACRFLNIAAGHFYIKVSGKVDPRARAIVCNHNSFEDGFIVSCAFRIRSTGQDGYRKIMPLRIILELSQIIWIDRSVAGGVSALCARSMDELDKRPLMSFAEGTMTNGDCILKFHRGAFLTKHPIQPLALRYWQSFVPKGWNTNAYIEPNFLKYLFGLLALPWSIVTLDVLPVIIPEEDETPDQLAVRTQLAIANHLKVKAVDRSSDELFKKRKATSQAPADRQKAAGEVEKPKED